MGVCTLRVSAPLRVLTRTLCTAQPQLERQLTEPSEIERSSHRRGHQLFHDCFTGAVLCDWLLDSGLAGDAQHALLIGQV